MLHFYQEVLGFDKEIEIPFPGIGVVNKLSYGAGYIKILVLESNPSNINPTGDFSTSNGIRYITINLSNLDEILDACKVNTEYELRKRQFDKSIEMKFKELRQGLELQNELNIIESYDVSHHAGKNAVAGCVVYTTQGKANKLYRSYSISKSNRGNDIGSMIELIERRFSDKKREPPDLIIIDGGQTHLKQVLQTFKALNILDVNVISISKGVRRKANFDNIHLPDGKSITIDKASIFHQFVQEIRDETHRYAITIQKKKMRKASIKSSLDDLSGIGVIRKKMLLRYFGSLEQIKRASIDDLSEVSGIGKSTAESVYKELHT